MIKFALACASGHEFESWFQNGAAFDLQAEAGLIACPICQTAQVTKAIMAPAIACGGRGEPAPAPQPTAESAEVALLDSRDKELRAMIVEVRKRILTEADDVGPRFPEEARKIHQGIVPERPIHGQASFDEARALIDEGVGIMPIPPLPRERN
jgi:hypothetical protein